MIFLFASNMQHLKSTDRHYKMFQMDVQSLWAETDLPTRATGLAFWLGPICFQTTLQIKAA